MENICDWKGCKKKGGFKAPLERDNSKKYQWLCEEHIKIFNKQWDYFAGMSDDAIQKFMRSDETWHRPTQKFNSKDNFFNSIWNNALDEDFKIFKTFQKFKTTNQKGEVLSQKDIEAFKIIDLNTNSSWSDIQKKFKSLVKKFHPDMNLGNKKYENKLKLITLAYSHLKTMVKENKLQ